MNTDIQRNLLIVKSKDRVSGSSSDFQYSLGDTTLDVRSLTLKSACIPHTYTNVSENNNDLILEIGAEFTLTTTAEANYNVNGVSSIPISAGVYTLNSLISTLNANQTFGEFTYDSISNRVIFTVTDAGVNVSGVTFLTGGTPEIIGLLGFSLPVNCPTGVGSQITATSAPTYVENNVFNLSITTGQYTSTTLLAEVMQELNIIFTTTGTGVINAVTGKVEIDAPTDTWLFRKSGIPELLGYYTPDMIFSNIQRAQGIPDLYGTRNLYVSSRVLSNGYNSLDANGVKSSILGDIPVCSSQGGIDKYQADYPIKKDYPNNINICNFDIKILDDYEKVVDLKGCNIVLVFEVYANTKL